MMSRGVLFDVSRIVLDVIIGLRVAADPCFEEANIGVGDGPLAL